MTRSFQFRLGLFALCFVSRAGAADPTLAFQAHIEGGAECKPGAFQSKLEQLSRRLRPALPSEPALDFELSIEEAQRKFSGKIRVRELDGNETVRTVEGASCDEVLSALALIAVVLVDPSAEGASHAPAHEVRQAGPPQEERESGSAPPRSWRFGAGVGAGLESAVSPELVATASFQVEALLDGDGIFSPRVAVAVQRSAGDTVRTPGGNAHFGWTAARVSLCPVRFPRAGRFAVRPCVFSDAGVLDVAGEQTYRPSSTHVTWLSFGGVARAEYWAVKPLALGLESGFVAPFVRDRFYFDPGGPADTLHVPRLGLTARVGLTVYFE